MKHNWKIEKAGVREGKTLNYHKCQNCEALSSAYPAGDRKARIKAKRFAEKDFPNCETNNKS